MIRLVIADDHAAVRRGLVDYFEAQHGIDVVGEAQNGREALDRCSEVATDVVLMDIRMPVMDGIEATREIKAQSPDTCVVLLSAYEQDELVAAGRQAGADAFVLKGTLGAELVERVREVCG
jgi:DNA-binding NarL/FixJ family response regulator